MSTIHIASPSGERSTVSEDQLRSRWTSGQLAEGTLYWLEGMAEWRPVEEFFLPQRASDSPSAPPPIPRPSYAYTIDPRSLTKFLVLMLWIYLGIEIASILGDMAQLSLLSREFTEEEALANDARQGRIGLVFLVVWFVTGITFLRWIHRAAKNSRGFGAEDMTITPGWSVGYYFIPFLNIVRPYQAMREIWMVSQNPSNWREQPGSAIVGWWWMLWLASGFFSQISFRMSMGAETLEDFQHSTQASIFASILSILLCLVAMKLVKSIAANQARLVTLT